jgi:hypothetical protein
MMMKTMIKKKKKMTEQMKLKGCCPQEAMLQQVKPLTKKQII